MITLQNSDPLLGLSEIQFNKVTSLFLPNSAPEHVRVDYHAACVLWVLGSSFPWFFTLASLHTGIALENALRTALSNKCIKIEKHNGLAKLFFKARETKVIDDSKLRDSEYLREYFELFDFRQRIEFELADIAAQIDEQHDPKIFGPLVDDLVKVIRDVRNEIAHGTHNRNITEAEARHHLELGRSIILALFLPGA